MSHETGELDVPDRHLRVTSARSRASVWTEIGEAQVTHTIFGRARVRIVRKHDNIRRALWLAAVLAVTVLAATSWQEWLASPPAEPLQSADPVPALNATVQESVPVTLPATIAMPATSDQGTPSRHETNDAVPGRQTVLQTAQSPNGAEPAAPVVAQPPAATSIEPKMSTDIRPSTRPASAKPPVAAAVAAPRAALPAAQPEATTPVVQGTSAQPPAGDKQPAEAANAQP